MASESNRRRFLWKAVQAVIPISLRPNGVLAADNGVSADNEKVKFLTADGDLIEMDQKIVDQLTKKSSEKTTNADILSWTNQVKIKANPNE